MRAHLLMTVAVRRAPWRRLHLWNLSLGSRCFRTTACPSASRKKRDTVFVCSDCGEEHLKVRSMCFIEDFLSLRSSIHRPLVPHLAFLQWNGQCNACGAWGTLKEFRPASPIETPGGVSSRLHQWKHRQNNATRPASAAAGSTSKSWTVRESDADAFGDFRSLSSISDGPHKSRRQIGMGELDRVLGGGLMPGSVTLCGGAPGAGKSTLLLQVASMLAHPEAGTTPLGRVAYISGEESVPQLKARADRLGLSTDGVLVMNETDLDTILEALLRLQPLERREGRSELGLDAIVVDSIQTVYLQGVAASAGSITQVRECALRLLQLAKATQTSVFLTGHITKSGELAGPKVLEHLVDTVLYMEGDGSHGHRLVRAAKNRFGSTDEVAVLEMTDGGLRDVTNPAKLFLTFTPGHADKDDEGDADGGPSNAQPHRGSGSAVTSTLEGSRPLCVEIQALCAPAALEFPRHRAQGVALDRLHMLLAVLSRQARAPPKRNDVYVNVVGGLRLSDPATDVALAMAIASSLLDTHLPRDVAFLGELGLGGEVRPVMQLMRRVRAIQQLGLRRCVVPAASLDGAAVAGMDLIPVKHIADVVQRFLRR